MLIKNLNILKNFLFLFTISLFCSMVIVKYNVYKLKKNIRDIQLKISLLEKEKDTLELELAYLTNPERLKVLYYEVQKIEHKDYNLDNNINLLSKSQIMDIKQLIPYYFSRIERYNKDESIAVK